MYDQKIVIVNYGMGNLKSVANALSFLGYHPIISDNKDAIVRSDALILPGVGAFGEAMKNLRDLGLTDILTDQVLEGRKPFLGICLGMQLIALESDELGHHAGLGWIDGRVAKIKASRNQRLPHVGWNTLEIRNKNPVFSNIDANPNFYFDHTYSLACEEIYVSATCNYDTEIIAAIQWENIFATQFHPEKSQVNGLKLLRNFLNFVENVREPTSSSNGHLDA